MNPLFRAFVVTALFAASTLGQGCTTRHTPVHPAAQPVVKPAAPGSDDAAVVPSGSASCEGMGPLRCDVAPALGTGEAICAQLRVCELRSAPGFRGEPIEKVTRCSEPTQRTKLVAAAGFTTAAVVRLEGGAASDDDGEQGPPGESAYLVAERNGRWCPVSRILPFAAHPSSRFEDTFSLTLLPESTRLYVSAHRVERGALDADEFAAGVSDVEYEGCDQFLYSLEPSGFRELRSKWTTPSSCEAGTLRATTASRHEQARSSQDTGDGALRCASAGPLACDLGESGEASQLCARLTQCAAHWNEPWLSRDIASCTEIGQRLALPPATGARQTVVLHTTGKHEMGSAESAYLVVERADGFCLVDQLFDPAEGYRKKPAPSCELVWGDDQQRLSVVCEHASRSLAAGTKRLVTTIEHELLAYSVRDGAFTRVQQQTRREPE